jgi:hypothetical protein
MTLSGPRRSRTQTPIAAISQFSWRKRRFVPPILKGGIGPKWRVRAYWDSAVAAGGRRGPASARGAPLPALKPDLKTLGDHLSADRDQIGKRPVALAPEG